jgi:biopolymer transport protein TolR
MAFSTNGSEGQSSEINVTPLIDVLLVLLIIFMVIVPVVPKGLAAATPSPSSHPDAAQQNDSPVLVRVDGESGSPVYQVNGERLGRNELGARLEILLAPRADRQMLVQADPGLNFETVADVLDLGKAAGAETVGLMTPATLTR